MTTLDQILARVKALPPEQQQEVLMFVERMLEPDRAPRQRKPLRGLWKDLGVDVSDEDIAEARREMWGNFPREDL